MTETDKAYWSTPFTLVFTMEGLTKWFSDDTLRIANFCGSSGVNMTVTGISWWGAKVRLFGLYCTGPTISPSTGTVTSGFFLLLVLIEMLFVKLPIGWVTGTSTWMV